MKELLKLIRFSDPCDGRKTVLDLGFSHSDRHAEFISASHDSEIPKQLTASPTHTGSQGSLRCACSLCKVRNDIWAGFRQFFGSFFKKNSYLSFGREKNFNAKTCLSIRNLREGNCKRFFASPCSALNDGKLVAFTLAEVLLTLTIIGVIATLTIVPLHADIEEQITVSKVSTTYKLMEDAYKMARAKYGSINRWGLSKSTQDCTNKDKRGGYCEGSTFHLGSVTKKMFEDIIDEEKLTPITVHYMNSEAENQEHLKYRLRNGVWLTELWVSNPRCNQKYGLIDDYCGDFKIDINGAEEPNTFGIDMFVFGVTKKHIIPLGIKGLDTLRQVKTHCNINSTETYNGYACTAWIIYKKNMKYLDKEVDWDDKD